MLISGNTFTFKDEMRNKSGGQQPDFILQTETCIKPLCLKGSGLFWGWNLAENSTLSSAI